MFIMLVSDARKSKQNYKMKTKDYIHVVSAEYSGGLSLRIVFNDKTERVVDFTDFFIKHPHPMHDKYANPMNFKKFMLRDGNIIWGKNGNMEFPVGALYRGNLELCCDEV